MSQESKKEEMFLSGFTIKGITIAVLTILIGFPIAFLLQNMSTKPATYTGFWLSPIQLVIVFELLRRASKKFHLNPQEMTMATLAGYMLMGITYWMSGYANEGIQEMVIDTLFYFSAAMAVSPFNQFYQKLVPSYFLPSSQKAIDLLWNGISPGESIDWGAWMTPMLVVSLWTLIWMIMSYAWMYVLWKPLIEDERLPFPAAVPTSQTIILGTSQSPDEKPRLFDFKNLMSKTYWIFFLIGLIFSLQPVLAEVIPLIPAASWWGEQRIRFEPFVKSFLPVTKYWNPKIMIAVMAVLVLAPFDTLITIVLTWFVLAVIVPNSLVWFAGWPANLAKNYRKIPPFPYYYWNGWGIDVGIGLWMLYLLLPRFKQLFSALKKDVEEYGASLKLVSYITILFSVLYVAFLIGVGAPVLTALWAFVLWLIFTLASIRYFGELAGWTYMEPWGNFFAEQTLWTTGVISGAWPGKLPTLQSNWAMPAVLSYMSMEWFGAQSPWFTFQAFKVAYDTKTKPWDVFKMLIILTVIAVFYGNFFALWFVHHTGGLKSQGWFAESTRDFIRDVLGANVVATVWPDWAWQNPGYALGLSLSGIITVFAIYLIRMRFPAFFIDPIGITAAIGWFEGIWINALLALIIKYLVLRFGGPKLYEERALPAVAGFSMGYGFFYIFAALNELFVVALPSFNVHFVP
ncbi:MAG: hypothetical protein J7K23_05895 [Thermoproteales archaeon]|nr:hypothetical protein [Thermoproteales archaeon]